MQKIHHRFELELKKNYEMLINLQIITNIQVLYSSVLELEN